MFGGQFEFDSRASVFSKIESGPYLIFLSFIYVLSAFLHFKPVYIELACFSIRNCLRWGGWETDYFKIQLISSGDFLSPPGPVEFEEQVGVKVRCFGWLWSSGRLQVAPRVENTEDHCLNLHLVPGCQGLRHRPSRENVEQRKLKGWEEGLTERAEHHP